MNTRTTKVSDIRRRHALSLAPDMAGMCEFDHSDRDEVLEFLSIRPVHTVVMTSFINDNGIESPLNRGKFFGYRNRHGKLEGVALIGHTTLVEARSDDALKVLAFQARRSTVPVHLIMSSGQEAEDFWSYFSEGFNVPRLTCTELLFEVSYPFPLISCDWEIRQATLDELIPAGEAQAAIALLECGVDPMLTDREGFLKRVARRIEQGRVYVVVENGELVFKADIIAETTEAIYLEGIYVAPGYRGRGIGSSCLNRLTAQLLKRVPNVCLLSNISFIDAHLSYLKAGYKNTDSCTTLFT